MLTELHIQNFALIDDLRLEVGAGFSALTGETGAGKSILIGGLELALEALCLPEVLPGWGCCLKGCSCSLCRSAPALLRSIPRLEWL